MRNMGGRERLLGFHLLLLIYSLVTVIAQDIIAPGQSLRDGETIVSADQSFELGFFSPGNSAGRYVGIWYKKVAFGTVVWVANRESPVFNTSGVLRIDDKGNLLLLNNAAGDVVVWSLNVTRTVHNPIARLLDTGNLVVNDGNDTSGNAGSYLWQSFDYPGDTLLPGMKLGINFVTGFDSSVISSWKSFDDPARGTYTFGIDPSGFPQLVIKNSSEAIFRLGLLNGFGVSGFLADKIEFIIDEKANYQFQYQHQFQFQNRTVPLRMVITSSGGLTSFVWTENQWIILGSYPLDLCDRYSLCGAYTTCDINKPGPCACLDGFYPLVLGHQGCFTIGELPCGKGAEFRKFSGTKLPDTSNSWFNESISLKECRQICLEKCSCTAYAGSFIRGADVSGCMLWFSELVDMKYINGGQDIYIRAAVSEELTRRKSWERKRKIVIICSTALPVLVIALGWILYTRKRKIQNREKIKYFIEKYSNDRNSREDLELQIFDLKTIMKATANFSSKNRLGKGGFGPVYKGTLADGQEIAVKRLSQNSGQGLEEFINEVILIARLQHNNLVRLLGCCIQDEERILVYEYMSNKSLDYFIFDQSRSRALNWRMRVNIIDGIARGLLYLHEDSRLRIIHRDIKASNILLDNDMNAKISDFGMARIFERNQTEANTKRVAGTYGYMSPEYAVDGLFSVKSDVFSFGVLVLEVVSGTKNRGFSSDDHDHNLLGHVWKLYMEERMPEVMQLGVEESCDLSEVLRRIHIGLLCVQKRPEDRPNMSTVVVMLGGESPLPKPKQPGFFIERNVLEIWSSSGGADRLASPNEMSMSLLDAR